VHVSFNRGPDSLAAAATYGFPATLNVTGIVFTRSRFSSAHVKDGTSNTYMIGEKYLSPEDLMNGSSAGDDQGAYVSDERDVVRYAAVGGGYQQPMQDRAGVSNTWNFGSAHSGGFQMVFCDGSVRSISYSIDQTTHRRLANRRDGQPIDMNSF
jgi:prepilin-type processing-associated H-X9-DG protein